MVAARAGSGPMTFFERMQAGKGITTTKPSGVDENSPLQPKAKPYPQVSTSDSWKDYCKPSGPFSQISKSEALSQSRPLNVNQVQNVSDQTLLSTPSVGINVVSSMVETASPARKAAGGDHRLLAREESVGNPSGSTLFNVDPATKPDPNVAEDTVKITGTETSANHNKPSSVTGVDGNVQSSIDNHSSTVGEAVGKDTAAIKAGHGVLPKLLSNQASIAASVTASHPRTRATQGPRDINMPKITVEDHEAACIQDERNIHVTPNTTADDHVRVSKAAFRDNKEEEVLMSDSTAVETCLTDAAILDMTRDIEDLREETMGVRLILNNYSDRFTGMESRLHDLEQQLRGHLGLLEVSINFPAGQVIKVQASRRTHLIELLHEVKNQTGRRFVSCTFKHKEQPMDMWKCLGDYRVQSGDMLSLVQYPEVTD